MNQKITHRITILLLLTIAVTLLNGCVYYNTMYHARRWFNEAESLRKQNNRDLAAGQENRLYSDAIVKCSSVLAEHPTSSWVDDALFMIGKSFYHLDQNNKAERKFRELLSSFPDSKYTTEARFYLGKARFKLESYAQARETFTEFMKTGSKKEWRSEATYLMGEISAAEGDTARAVEYLKEYLEKFSGSAREQEVQSEVGQFQFALGNFSEAAKAFGEAAEATDDPSKRYFALYDQGRSYYRLDSAEAGLEIYRMLQDEQQDSVKLGDILLRIAEGLDLKGEQRDAILLYDAVGTEFNQRKEAAEALYQLGVICQEDFNDLELAKEYFDQASRIQRGGDFRSVAIERAAEITKVETFRAKLNSESKEEASRSRFLLAELYRTTLKSPDSALVEYQDLVRTFPESGYAPKALLNIGYLYETYLDDTISASDYYQQVLTEYPRSDEVTSALKLLGDDAEEPSQLYPDKLYRMAEEQRFDEHNLDSSLALYQLFIEEFPESENVPRADFAAAKVRLEQFIPSEDPPKINPYRVADSLLAIEAARQDSVARKTADSLLYARQDSVRGNKPARTVAASPADSIVTVNYAGGETIIDTTGGEGDEIRLTDFIGGEERESEQSSDSLNQNVIEDTLPQVSRGENTTESRMRDKASGAARNDDSKDTTSLRKIQGKPLESDSLRAGKPPDKKRITLNNFPTAPADSSVDTTSAEIDTSAALPQTTIDLESGDSLSALNTLMGADSTMADSAAADTTTVVIVDSSMIWLFQHLANKYEGTDIGKEASRLAKGQGVRRPERQLQRPQQPQTPVVQADTSKPLLDSIPDNPFAFQDTTGGAQGIEDALREEIDKWPLMQDEPIDIPEFDYPQEAAASKFKGRVTTKIKIDFDGRVVEVELLKGTNVPLLDLEVKNTLLETFFDPLKIEPLHLGGYFIYYYEIELPEVWR